MGRRGRGAVSCAWEEGNALIEGAAQSVLDRLWRTLRGRSGALNGIDPEPATEVASPTTEQPSQSHPRIIYDVGANNGDDLPYYLLKADRVVAIEADPQLAAQIERRFADEIQTGRLIVETCVVTVDASGVEVPFYINKGLNVLSQFGRPPEADIHHFEEVHLPSKRLVDIVRRHGAPHYVKIDVEGYDHKLLAHLFSKGVRPPYISAESHSVEVFAALVAFGGYNAFKLVNGHTVHEVYREVPIQTRDGLQTHSFPYHSAGPFGDDVQGCWESANTFLKTLADAGLGWADIHASAIDAPEK